MKSNYFRVILNVFVYFLLSNGRVNPWITPFRRAERDGYTFGLKFAKGKKCESILLLLATSRYTRKVRVP